MAFLTLDQLPFVGMSYEFRGEKEGAPFSSSLSLRNPARARRYTRIRMSKSLLRLKVAPPSRSVMKPAKCNPARIVVIPANTPHQFVNTGETTLRQIDIHASPRFIQDKSRPRSLGKMCPMVP